VIGSGRVNLKLRVLKGHFMLPSGIRVKFQAQLDTHHVGHVWQISTKVNSADLYLENSYIKDYVHVSHHASGQWHYALPGEPREYLAISVRRGEVAPGWVHASRIVIAKEDAVLSRIDSTAIPVAFHPDYPAICMDLFIAELGASPVLVSEAFLIEEFTLGTTHKAVLISRPYGYKESPQEFFQDKIPQFQSDLQSRGWDGQLTSIIVIFDTESEFGYLQQVELSVGKLDN
jgi:hypothetical protein